MEEPLPSVTLDDALAAEQEAIRDLRRVPPGETVAEARARAGRLIEAQKRRIAASCRTVAATQANGSNGHALALKQSDKSDGLITRDEFRALAGGLVPFVRELLAEAVVEDRSGGITREEVRALAEGLVPFLNERLAEAVTPLERRCDELENVVRTLVQSAAGRHG